MARCTRSGGCRRGRRLTGRRSARTCAARLHSSRPSSPRSSRAISGAPAAGGTAPAAPPARSDAARSRSTSSALRWSRSTTNGRLLSLRSQTYEHHGGRLQLLDRSLTTGRRPPALRAARQIPYLIKLGRRTVFDVSCERSPRLGSKDFAFGKVAASSPALGKQGD